MSEEGLEIPEASHGAGRLEQAVAIFTAIIAAFGAVVGFEGGHLMNEALLTKNEAVLRKAEATDQWSYYQAASTKMHLAELAQQLVPPERAGQFDEKLKKYATQRDELKTKATELDEASRHADEESDNLARPHTRFAMAMIFLQLAISMASVTALTQRRWLFGVAIASAAGGIALCVATLLMGA